MVFNQQISFGDLDSIGEASEEYRKFEEKFKPKKTTDDCYTPEPVYQAVVDWAVAEYGIDPADIVRPFYPGGDYERFDYPEGCVVLDNPPFSLVSQIVKFYRRNGVRFFLFTPALTMACRDIEGVTFIWCHAKLTYANGANVPTNFCTNLPDPYVVRLAPELRKACEDASDEARKARTGAKQQATYVYPYEVLSPAMCGKISARGVDLRIPKGEAFYVSKLDSQKSAGKSIFGGAILLSERAAAERANATVWELSDRERAIIDRLGGQKK